MPFCPLLTYFTPPRLEQPSVTPTFVECKKENCYFYLVEEQACCLSLTKKLPQVLKENTSRVVDGLEKILKDTLDKDNLFREILAKLETVKQATLEFKEKTFTILNGLENENKKENEQLEKLITQNNLLLKALLELSESNQALLRQSESLEKEVLEKLKEELAHHLREISSEFKNFSNTVKETHQQILNFLKLEVEKLNFEKEERQKRQARECNERGVAYFYEGAFEAARVEFEKAIELQPNSPEGYNNLGLVLTKQNKPREAEEAFKKALQLNPTLTPAYTNLGFSYHLRGDYLKAVEVFNEALKQDANSSSVYFNLGNAYEKLERFKEALAAWERALEIDPANELAAKKLKEYKIKGIK
jgi:Flp pilus assembly protein TadD